MPRCVGLASPGRPEPKDGHSDKTKLVMVIKPNGQNEHGESRYGRETDPVSGVAGEVHGEQLDGLERRGGSGPDLGDHHLHEARAAIESLNYDDDVEGTAGRTAGPPGHARTQAATHLVGADGDVGAVEEGVALDEVVVGERVRGEGLAAGDGGVVRADVEAVAQAEEVVRRRRHAPVRPSGE